MDKIEYRVRPVTRYIVTRYEQSGGSGNAGVSMAGEYDNADTAYQVGYALCKAEHDRLGWPPGDERIKYPVGIPKGAQIAQHTGDGAWPPPLSPSSALCG